MGADDAKPFALPEPEPKAPPLEAGALLDCPKPKPPAGAGAVAGAAADAVELKPPKVDVDLAAPLLPKANGVVPLAPGVEEPKADPPFAAGCPKPVAG